ncbi:hypothetical protein C0995_016107 [Termitomyces sp. Mi166|nr:hypothetical protein C0995_016107 [Termitomyces sp. Mi166\
MPSFAIHAIGAGANGETTYAEDTVRSVFVDEIAPLNGGFYTTDGIATTSTVSTETTTYTSEPFTYHAILVQDATHNVYHQELEASTTSACSTVKAPDRASRSTGWVFRMPGPQPRLGRAPWSRSTR